MSSTFPEGQRSSTFSSLYWHSYPSLDCSVLSKSLELIRFKSSLHVLAPSWHCSWCVWS